MKIFFLTPSVRLLGARQSLLLLVRNLPDDCEPMVVCPSGEGLTQELQRSGIPTAVVPHGAWRKLGGRLTAMFRQLPAVRREIGRFSPDVVHANEFHSTPAAVRGSLPLRRRGKVGVTSHIRLGITHRQVRNYELAHSNRIAAVSHACRHLFDGTGLEDRVDVIYNGVDVSALRGRESTRELRASHKMGKGTLVLGLFGLVSPRKNQLVAAEAVAKANKMGAPTHLLLAGDAFKSTEEYGARLRERIAQDDLCGRVTWLPFQEDVFPLYDAIDVNLLISSEEGFGRTIIEAGALGKPSIGARTGGIPELIEEEKTGWLVDEGSVDQLAEKIVDAARHRDRVAEFGNSARHRVGEHFTIEAHVQAMIRFWERALEDAGKTLR